MIYNRYTDFRAVFATSSTPRANDGLEVYPAANVRAGGFTGGFSGLTRPLTFPLTVSCNGLGVDTLVAGPPAVYIHEYDWYLSQRTEVDADKYLYLESFSDSQSGTVILGLTSLASTRYPTLDEDALNALFRHCALYVQRRGDKAIQWIDLLSVVSTRRSF